MVINVFSGTFIPDDGSKRRKKTIPKDMLQSVRLDCQNLDDDSRWLMSLTSGTVMWLSETCRLLVSDIHFDLAKPFVDLTEHLWPELKIESSRKPR